MNPFSISSHSKDKFCNRVQEIAALKQYMCNGIHVVVYAPRRFGKSSLAKIVQAGLTEMDCIYVDLFSVTSIDEVASLLYYEIANSLGKAAAQQTTFLKRLGEFFSRVRFSLSYDAQGNTPTIDVALGSAPPDICIKEVIESLDAFCKKNNRRACVVLDEFQEICELKESKQIEAFLRGGMQKAEWVSFIFMGSRRTILRDMFENKKRPFYKSTISLELPYIKHDVFADFIADCFAQAGYPIQRETADEIVAFTKAYPYYTQKLALLYFNALESGNNNLLSAQQELVRSESSDCENIFVNLSTNQKKLLKALARNPTANLYASEYLRVNHLGAASSVKAAFERLKQLDLIEFRNELWQTVDPIMEKWCQLHRKPWMR